MIFFLATISFFLLQEENYCAKQKKKSCEKEKLFCYDLRKKIMASKNIFVSEWISTDKCLFPS